jgi:hypothetical protein
VEIKSYFIELITCLKEIITSKDRSMGNNKRRDNELTPVEAN